MYETADSGDDAAAPPGHDDPHLRSTRNVTGYHIDAADGEIGHVTDYVIDDQSWALRFIVVDTRNWLPGRSVLISPHWIRRVEWGEAKVTVDLSREAVEHSPEFDPLQPVSVDYEGKLHDYYGRPSAPATAAGGTPPSPAPATGTVRGTTHEE